MKKDMVTVLNDYLYHIQYTQPKSENTVDAYRIDLEHFLEYLQSIEIKKFEDLSYEILLTYINELNEIYASNSIDRKIASIRNLFKYLIQYNIIDTNITAYLKNKKRPLQLPKSLNESQLNQLLSFKKEDAKDYLDIAILTLLFKTGIRVSECVNLTFSQVYEEERWLRIIGKGNKERMVPIDEDTLSKLQYYTRTIRPTLSNKGSNRVFITLRGNPVTRQYIHTMIQKRRMETNLTQEVSAHTLRHSLATNLLQNDVDLRVIQEILGHTDIATTQIYTHVSNETVKNEYDKYLNANFSKKGEQE